MNRRKTTKTMWTTARPLGLFAVAVLALSAGAPFEVRSADKKAAIEESDAKMAGLVGPLMNEAITLFRAGKYEQALLKCNEMDKVFATQRFAASSQLTAQKSMISQLRSEIQAKWGALLMQDIRTAYSEAERLLMVRTNPNLAKDESEKDSSRCEQRAIALLKNIVVDADKVAAKLPSVKPEAMTLKAAAVKYLAKPSLAWGMKSAQESVRRENIFLKEINPLCQDAAKFLNQKSYKRAYAKWQEASKKLESLKYSDSPKLLELKSQLISLRREIVRQWELAYVMSIRASYIRASELAPSDPKQAMAIARGTLNRIVEAKAELPPPIQSKALADLESACNKLVKSEEFIEATSLSSIDEVQDLKDRRQNIEKLLLKADTYYRNKMYAKARDTYEQVYILDPFNENANIMLGKIYRKIIDTAWMRRENEILERINEVEWKWVLPSRQATEDPLDETPVQDEATTERASIYKKLQDISYPGADFEDESVSDVFAQIQRRSRELDPEKKGISIYYPQFKDDKFVTLKMGALPIGELIRYVCMYAGLKYKITHQGIVIGDDTLDDMRDQTFTMSNTLYDTITAVGSGETQSLLATEGDSEGLFGGDDKGGKSTTSKQASSAESGATTSGSDALKSFFVECGIPFGEGTGISYNKNANKLIVRNTPDNLRTIATLLEKIDVETELVLVEAKIIEISVTDLEELGFDWTLTHNNTDPEFLFGNATQVNSTFGASDTYRLGEAVINQVLVRHTGGGGSGGNFSTEDAIGALNLINNLNIIPNFGKDGAYNMFLTVHAVDQSARGEVIAAPKVLAKSRTEAKIEMVQRMYFPESWEDAELEEGNNTFEYTPPVPEMGDSEPIGTTFTVTPEVSTNLRTITLLLSPSITALVGWTDYDYQFIIGSIRSVSSTSNVYAAKMKMPEISDRSLLTQLKIYDGDTVVLGGVLQEQSMKRDDKYPFLGDIPLVGTLFSNKATRTIKQNLLIFVTPRLIGYNGVPVNAVPDKGRFDFNR